MPRFGQDRRQSTSVTLTGASSEKITNLLLTLASTEYSLALTANLKQIIIRSRGNSTLQIAFTVNESGTNFITIPPGATLSFTDLNFNGKTLYLQSNKASDVAEIMELF